MVLNERYGFFVKPALLNIGEEQQIRSVFDSILSDLDIEQSAILQVMFVVDAPTSSAYKRFRDIIASINSELGTPIPVYSVLAQKPYGETSIMAEVVVQNRIDGLDLNLKQHDGFNYWELISGKNRELIVAGIGSYSDDIEYDSRFCFDIINKIMAKEGVGYGEVYRQWNYIGEITKELDSKQNYQVFNDVRSIYYDVADWFNGYPAATGIGMEQPGVVIGLYIINRESESEVISISNPRQIDAHSYSDDVLIGDQLEELPTRTTPKFERAKAVVSNCDGMVYVSGTASIIGEETVMLDDVVEQTRVTLENIDLLVDPTAQKELAKFNHFSSGSIHKLKVYVKDRENFKLVDDFMKESVKDIPYLVVEADVCRDDLLVEIEGIYKF